MSENLKVVLRERVTDTQRQIPTYDELLREVDLMEIVNNNPLSDTVEQEIQYDDNNTKRDMEKIADYYEIHKGKKNKSTLIREIVSYENKIINIEIVFKRKKLWSYLNEIKADKYLSRYLIFE
jgi:hypothetical protein